MRTIMRHRWILLTLGALALLCDRSMLFCQTDTIGGVINRYTRLRYIECTGNSAINVADPYGFRVGDRILIVQMKGAEIDRRDTATFGSITQYDNAGNYELATIDQINGRTFVLHYELARSYNLSGIVQVVRVPSYGNVVIRDAVRPQPWDGSTGGVVALIATGTVIMNADINTVGVGFRGTFHRWSRSHLDTLFGARLATAHSGRFNEYCRFDNWDSGGIKGEGIHEPDSAYMGARGRLASGGGGGNMFTSGGGGGSNAGYGGNGGDDIGAVANGGIGGDSLPYSNALQRIYLGGSGGAGGPTDEYSRPGGESGGGIVFVRANQITANGYRILANGINADSLSTDSLGGGGGAGGVVLLDVLTYSDTLHVSAAGGKGGDISSVCYGPGGGGSGGCIWFSNSSVPGLAVTSVTGGVHGSVIGGSCAGGSARNAQSGGNGLVLTNLQIPQGTTRR